MKKTGREGEPATLFTIGFTGKSAEQFFEALQAAGVKVVIDIRLKNDSQLSGFAKKKDLAYFLRALGGIEYRHAPELAPTPELLEGFRSKKISWDEYEPAFKLLLAERQAVAGFARADLDAACLLCSEPTPEHCHRRLVAEAFARQWPELAVEHL